MVVEDLLKQRRREILKAWFRVIAETYPKETARFLESERDPFANPVGSTFTQGMEALLDALLKGLGAEYLRSILDSIIRVRAIQDFTPSQALGFVFLLKDVIRKELLQDMAEKTLAEHVRAFESKVDALVLLSFDIYMQCREKLYEVRANEIKRRYSYVIKRMHLFSEASPEEAEQPDEVH